MSVFEDRWHNVDNSMQAEANIVGFQFDSEHSQSNQRNSEQLTCIGNWKHNKHTIWDDCGNVEEQEYSNHEHVYL